MAANDSYDAMFDAAGRYYNVDPQLLKTIFHVESGGNPATKPSYAGAVGGMQFMPGTARQYGVADPTDMTQAVPAAARYIRDALNTNGGDPVAALRAYNGGQGGVHSPATVPYVLRAAQLYPQMQLKTKTQPKDDAFDLGDQVLSGKSSPPAKPPSGSLGPSQGAPPQGPTQGAPPAVDDAYKLGDELLSAPTSPSSSEAAKTPKVTVSQVENPPANPQTGQTDTIAPGLRSALATDPNYQYGSVIPLKQNKLTGEFSATVPTAMRDFAGGLLDLAEGPTTGTVTPQGTMALGNLMIGGPKTFGSVASEAANAARAPSATALMGRQAAKEVAEQPNLLSGEFKANPMAKDVTGVAPSGPSTLTGLGLKLDKTSTPTENPMSPATQKFVEMMNTAIANKIAHAAGAAVGHQFGSIPGAMTGYVLGPIIKDIAAQYGPKVAAAVWAASKGIGGSIDRGVEQNVYRNLLVPGAGESVQQQLAPPPPNPNQTPYEKIIPYVGGPYS